MKRSAIVVVLALCAGLAARATAQTGTETIASRGSWGSRGTAMSAFDFLIETYRTERLKTLGVWAQIPDERMGFRSEPRARTPLEHMVHQCQSEHNWMTTMLGIEIGIDALPKEESRAAFLEHYGTCAQ